MLKLGGDKVVVDGFSILLLDSLNNLLFILRFLGFTIHVGGNKRLVSLVPIAAPAGGGSPSTNPLLAADSTMAEKEKNGRE